MPQGIARQRREVQWDPHTIDVETGQDSSVAVSAQGSHCHVRRAAERERASAPRPARGGCPGRGEMDIEIREVADTGRYRNGALALHLGDTGAVDPTADSDEYLVRRARQITRC